MFFYDFEHLDDFIDCTLTKSLPQEKKRIGEIISLYDTKRSNLFALTNHIISITNTLDINNLDDFEQTIYLLKKSFEQIEKIHHYSKTLEENLNTISSFSEKNISHYKNEIKANLVEYNKQDEKLHHQILDYEKSISAVVNAIIELTLSVSSSSIIKSEKKLQGKITTNQPVLLVSEREQVAYLPYRYSDLEKIYQNSSYAYSSLEDIVEKLYILPLSRFKNSSLSRFREAFLLMRNKENASILKALDLGLELMFNYDLNPIIIAACRNLDELDIYLDCLAENELSDFDCFEIRFEIAPKVN